MARIEFTDDIGAATLTNRKPAPGNRFANWLPLPNPVGDVAERDSDGARFMFSYRDDWSASFELRGIPMRPVAGVSMVDIAARLKRHLLRGGQCAVFTEDAEANSYPTCGIASGTTPQLQQSNARTLEYDLSVSLTNLAVDPGQMVCHY